MKQKIVAATEVIGEVPHGATLAFGTFGPHDIPSVHVDALMTGSCGADDGDLDCSLARSEFAE